MPSVNQITLVRDGRLCTHGERWLTDIVRITGLGKGRGQAGPDEQKIVSALRAAKSRPLDREDRF
jgi:hypothetical protein